MLGEEKQALIAENGKINQELTSWEIKQQLEKKVDVASTLHASISILPR
ncbi:MAG: hypothetical protein U0T56_02265 [Ferruginibacter sp.]